MTATIDDLRDFLNDTGATQLYTDIELNRALKQAGDILTKREISPTGYSGDRIVIIQAALFSTLKNLQPSPASTTSGPISSIRDGDTTITYATNNSQVAIETQKSMRIGWQKELDELILMSDDPILADYTDE